MKNICPTCGTRYDCSKQGKTRRGENYCSLACADDMDGNVTLFPSDLCRSVPCVSLASSTWIALTKACGVSSKPSVAELRMMEANVSVLTSREFRWLEIRATLEEFADIGGVDVSFLHTYQSPTP
jgi:hypothetical protein